jgi:Tol biopolymer transport system component
LTFDEDATSRYPFCGPNGRIAYEQVVAGRPIGAWAMDEDGSNKLPLSAGLSVSARIPQWDAEAQRVFTLVEPGPKQESYFGWIDVATRQLTRIPVPSSGAANLPMLSADGRQLAFHLVAKDGVVNVWVQPLAGGAPRQVTFDPEAISYPRWSDDGEWLAVNVKRGEHTHVGVVRAKGGPVEQLTAGRETIWGFSFSPDGGRIAFAGAQGGGDSNIYTVSRRTREVKEVTAGGRWPAFSPRGNRIVFSRAERTASLWTVKLP